MLIAVYQFYLLGPVASGKSSLLTAILGELTQVNGVMRIASDVLSDGFAYVPQEPWILVSPFCDLILCRRRINDDFMSISYREGYIITILHFDITRMAR